MKHYFIVNPAAGKGKYLTSLLTKIKFASEDLGIDYVVYHTRTTGDATRYVREVCTEHPDTDLRFYACGGDGTLNEVVSGVIGFPNAEVAVVPVGTGNDFVRNFTRPNNFLNLKNQILGEPIVIDLMKYNQKYAINEVNVGLDCEVVQKMEELKKNALIPGGLTYYAAVVSKFFGKFGTHLSISLDGAKPCDYDVTLIAIANGTSYGGGFKAAPLARLDDGLLDVCLVGSATKLDFIKAIGDYKNGTHVGAGKNYPFVKYKKVRKVEIKTDNVTPVCADGEISPFRSLTIEVLPKAIKLSLPHGSSYAEAAEPIEE